MSGRRVTMPVPRKDPSDQSLNHGRLARGLRTKRHNLGELQLLAAAERTALLPVIPPPLGELPPLPTTPRPAFCRVRWRRCCRINGESHLPATTAGAVPFMAVAPLPSHLAAPLIHSREHVLQLVHHRNEVL